MAQITEKGPRELRELGNWSKHIEPSSPNNDPHLQILNQSFTISSAANFTIIITTIITPWSSHTSKQQHLDTCTTTWNSSPPSLPPSCRPLLVLCTYVGLFATLSSFSASSSFPFPVSLVAEADGGWSLRWAELEGTWSVGRYLFCCVLARPVSQSVVWACVDDVVEEPSLSMYLQKQQAMSVCIQLRK